MCRDPKHLTLQPSHGWPQMPLRHCPVLNTGPRSRECPLGWIPGCQSLCRANTESSCWVFGKAASGSLMSNLQGCFPPLMVQNSLGGQGAGWLDGAQAHDGQQLEKQKWRTPSWSWLQRQLPWEAPPLPAQWEGRPSCHLHIFEWGNSPEKCLGHPTPKEASCWTPTPVLLDHKGGGLPPRQAPPYQSKIIGRRNRVG